MTYSPYPTVHDAARRAPVVLHRPDHPDVTGRLVGVRGERFRVQLPSGAFLTARPGQIEVTG